MLFLGVEDRPMKSIKLLVIALLAISLTGGYLPLGIIQGPSIVPIVEARGIPQKGIAVRKEAIKESIPFSIKRVNDPKLAQGKEVIKRKGRNGTKTFRYKVTYTDGKETNRELISEKVTRKPREQIVRVGTKPNIIEEKVAIPHKSTTTKDSTLLKGETRITQVGADGEKTLKYDIQIKDGAEVSRKLISEVVTVQPVTEIKNIGTKTVVAPVTAPNGTYKNVDGNYVPRPYQAPSAPAGASAQCRDGSYSFSAHRQGTCSRHGGVARWL